MQRGKNTRQPPPKLVEETEEFDHNSGQEEYESEMHYQEVDDDQADVRLESSPEYDTIEFTPPPRSEKTTGSQGYKNSKQSQPLKAPVRNVYESLPQEYATEELDDEEEFDQSSRQRRVTSIQSESYTNVEESSRRMTMGSQSKGSNSISGHQGKLGNLNQNSNSGLNLNVASANIGSKNKNAFISIQPEFDSQESSNYNSKDNSRETSAKRKAKIEALSISTDEKDLGPTSYPAAKIKAQRAVKPPPASSQLKTTVTKSQFVTQPAPARPSLPPRQSAGTTITNTNTTGHTHTMTTNATSASSGTYSQAASKSSIPPRPSGHSQHTHLDRQQTSHQQQQHDQQSPAHRSGSHTSVRQSTASADRKRTRTTVGGSLDSGAGSEVDDDDAQDAMVAMSCLKGLFRLDTLVISYLSTRRITALNTLKKYSRSSTATNASILLSRMAKLQKNRFIQKLTKTYSTKPRRVLLKWKVLSDELFLAKKIPRIALVSRLNYMVAIFRFKHLLNVKKVVQAKTLKAFQRGFQKFFTVADELEQKRGDNFANLLSGFSRIKDRYHRVIRMESFLNVVEKITQRRNHSEHFIRQLVSHSRLKSLIASRLRYASMSKSRQALYHLKAYSSMSGLLNSSNRPTDLDFYLAFDALKKAVSVRVDALIHMPHRSNKGLGIVHDLVEKKRKGHLANALDRIRGDTVQKTNSGALQLGLILGKKLEAYQRTGFRKIRAKANTSHLKKKRQIINEIWDHLEDKTRNCFQELIDHAAISLKKELRLKNGAMGCLDLLEMIRLNRQRSAFAKIVSDHKQAKIETHLQLVHAWSTSNKDAISKKMIRRGYNQLKGFLKLQRLLRRIMKPEISIALTRMRVEGIRTKYIDKEKVRLDEMQKRLASLANQRTKFAMNQIRLQQYRAMIRREKLDMIIRKMEAVNEASSPRAMQIQTPRNLAVSKEMMALAMRSFIQS